MASAPQPPLPLFYNDLMPLNSNDHASWRMRPSDKAKWLVGQHAVPVTADELVQAQRDFPIVFSAGENPVPLALMGLNEGVNVFVDEEGRIEAPVYLPAYVRRYPFMLVKLRQDSDDLSLCFDPTSDMLGEDGDGEPLFVDGQPSETTQRVLQFCEQFEQAGQRTKFFMDELHKHGLLMDGEVTITQPDLSDQPFVYRGFQMIDQDKLRELRGDQLRAWNQNGMLPLIFAQIASLELMRTIFAKQAEKGLVPQQKANTSNA
ncbi:multidrug transporter [Erythrobacteraceae bacterium CFH 75059]|uniref:SapC family protein n=1 Tax=Qipengyuania thermophila TaxID=2509361 RepID=UPI001020E5BF|nr:SapC family protein [Qipengyuania thermophila]TCD05415.1 multidrug transporter [Erythrobacteraceae bacterium CFH 75059]